MNKSFKRCVKTTPSQVIADVPYPTIIKGVCYMPSKESSKTVSNRWLSR